MMNDMYQGIDNMDLITKMFGKKGKIKRTVKNIPIQTLPSTKNKRQRYNDLIGRGKYSAVEALMIIEKEIRNGTKYEHK